jgi:hypothetical protein
VFPNLQMLQRLNDLTVELELLATRPVRKGANRYIDRIGDPDLEQRLSQPAPIRVQVDRFQEFMADDRRAIVKAMRRDLG